MTPPGRPMAANNPAPNPGSTAAKHHIPTPFFTKPTNAWSDGGKQQAVEPEPEKYKDYGELPDIDNEETPENPGNKTVADPSTDEEGENILVPYGQEKQPALAAVAKMIENRSRMRKHEGEDVELLDQYIDDKAGRVPKLELAPKLTVRDMMPKGEEDETGPIDPSQVVNLAARGNCVELCLVQKILEKGTTYLAKPKKFIFDEVTGSCAAALICENPDWCNVLESAEMNRAGVGIITLNYGNYTAAERYRTLITSCSNDTISFATYPATEVLKRYAITAYIHPGLKHIPTKMLAQVFKGYVNYAYYLNTYLKLARVNLNIHLLIAKPINTYQLKLILYSSSSSSSLRSCNPQIRGSFTLVDNRTITSGDKIGARIISFDPSTEFMDWLKTTKRSDKFRMAHKRIYINGGHRADGRTARNTPPPHSPGSYLLPRGCC